MQTTEVLNLKTGATLIYCGITPRAAVRAAHAQSLGDWNTWDYATYDALVRETTRVINCGNFASVKNKPHS